ncbi:hypothetical protein CJ030_MR8G025487 [Morella rubra]|uniref:Uncharacterized protein n=1 Tax=Morella rubra TaxID=262757 RepID=A0A6A1UT79_9ROSI|nr:hypothetical protein CJ030_MR8G025487 [Morella rubra]
MGFVQNDDDQWVKKVVANPSQDIQVEAAGEDEVEEEDLEEVEEVVEDRPESDVPVTASSRTPATGRSVFAGSHATRLALLEASILDLQDQLFSIHIDLWIGLEEIHSLLESRTVDFAVLIRKAHMIRTNYNNNLTVGRNVMWDWWKTFRRQSNELKKSMDIMTTTITRATTTISHHVNVF